MIDARGIVLGIVIIINIAVAFLAFYRDKKSVTNRAFILLSVSISLWIISIYLSDHPLLTSRALLWNRLTMFCGFLMGIFLLYFAVVFPKKSLRINWSWRLIITLGFIFIPLSGTKYVVKDIEFYSWGTNIIPGSLFIPMIIWAVIDILLTIYILVYKYITFSGIEKIRLKYVLLGFLNFLGINLLTNLLLPTITGTNELAKYGPIATVFLIGFFAYAIIRHRLMDIRLLMLKSLAYSIVLGFIALIYATGTHIIIAKYNGEPLHQDLFTISIIFLAIFCFNPLRIFIEKLSNRIFAKGKYNFSILLKKLGNITSTKVIREDLVNSLLKTITREINISRANFVMTNSNAISELYTKGSNICNLEDKQNWQNIINFINDNKIIFLDELKEDSAKMNILRKTKTEVVIPLQTVGSNGKIVGLLALGEKLSGDMYTSQDLKLLELIAPQIAIAVQNSNLLKEREKRIAELDSLNKLAFSLNSTLELEQVLDDVLEEALYVTVGETGSIMLLDDEGLTLSIKSSKGIPVEVARKTKVRIGDGIVGWVVENNQPLRIVNGQHEDKELESYLKRDDITSALAVPLKIKEKVFGVLSVSRKKNKEVFTKEDLNLITTYAAQAAGAIENARLYEKSEIQFIETVKTLAGAVDAKDHYTFGHSEEVTKYAVAIAEEMGFSKKEIRKIEIGARLHDIGKIGIPEDILNKPGKLTKEERKIINTHPKIAIEILKSATSLSDYTPLILFHHERYDGKGYPSGMVGKAIPIGARIIAVADAWNAMCSKRPYRNALHIEIAIEELKKNAGTQFDPEIVEALIRILERHDNKDYHKIIEIC